MKFRIDLKILFFLALFFFTGQINLYLIVMAFAFLHELAHLVVGKILGFRPLEIELMPFGFWISLNPKIEDYKIHILKSNFVELKYIFVAMAGPLLNLIFLIIFGNNSFLPKTLEIISNTIDGSLTLRQIILYSNLLLFLLNLVPIVPLDGGRILQSILRIFIGNKNADESINIIANIAIILLTIVGSIAILYLKNFAVVLVLTYLWILVIRENRRFRLKNKF